MKLKDMVNVTALVSLVLVTIIGLISTVIYNNIVLMNLTVTFLKLIFKQADDSRIFNAIYNISTGWPGFVLMAVIIYAVYLAIPPVIDISRNISFAKKGIKFSPKAKKFRATKLIHPKPDKEHHTITDLESFKKSRKWPEEISLKNQLIRETINAKVGSEGYFTTTSVMKSLEKAFDFSIREKHMLLDDVRSLISSDSRLSKLKKTLEVK